MGRTRKITPDDILDAAERVVTRLGAAGLSIDAVAQEAGVSKSRVVYDHKSKSALLEALIDRALSEEMDRVEQSVAGHSDAPHPELFGRITLAEQVPDDADRAVALAISASMSTEEKVQRQMREWISMDLQAMSNGARPTAALLAYLTLTGFYCTELFSFHHWDPAQRTEILEGIRTIYATYPENT